MKAESNRNSKDRLRVPHGGRGEDITIKDQNRSNSESVLRKSESKRSQEGLQANNRADSKSNNAPSVAYGGLGGLNATIYLPTQGSNEGLGVGIDRDTSSYFDRVEKDIKEKTRREMFDLLLNLDGTNEVSIKSLLDIPYKVEGEDELLTLNQS